MTGRSSVARTLARITAAVDAANPATPPYLTVGILVDRAEDVDAIATNLFGRTGYPGHTASGPVGPMAHVLVFRGDVEPPADAEPPRADWPPRIGDLWRTDDGMLWFYRGRVGADPVFVPAQETTEADPDHQWPVTADDLHRRGRVSLVHREPARTGGEPR